MRIGAHIRNDDPLGTAEELGADVVQFFLSDPQTWQVPAAHPHTEALLASDLAVFVHAPYVINVASPNNRIRIPSRKAVQQQAEAAARLGAQGLIVHGGHVTKNDDPEEGLVNWRKLFERQTDHGGFAVPILIENTAGGDKAMARRFDMLARLWDQIGEFGAGFCLDTCHAHAAGEDLNGIADRVRAITGRIDLVHLNDSRDPFGSSRDRHANIGTGFIDPEVLVSVVAAAQAPVVVETPDKGQAADIAFLREQLAS